MKRTFMKTTRQSAYAVASRMGFGWIDSAASRVGYNNVVFNRFCNTPNRLGPALWVGLSPSGKQWVIEMEEGNEDLRE